jgi:hypothetical protein
MSDPTADRIASTLGDTPAVRHLLAMRELGEQAHAYHLAVLTDANALYHEIELLTAYAWEEVWREHDRGDAAAVRRADADRMRLRPPPDYDAERPIPVRPMLSESMRETLVLLADPEGTARIAESEASIAAGDVTTGEGMQEIMSRRSEEHPPA